MACWPGFADGNWKPHGVCPLRVLSLALCLYGLYAFFARQIPQYLFLRTAFLLFDESRSAPAFFGETIALIWLFAALGCLLRRALVRAGRRQAGL